MAENKITVVAKCRAKPGMQDTVKKEITLWEMISEVND